MSKIDGGLRAEFRKYLPEFDWTSIESGTTGGGIPDSNYCHQGVDGWIEYKVTTGWAITLRPEQCGWITRRIRHGGRVAIAVRRRTSGGPRQGPPVDQLWLVPGRYAVQAKAHGLRPLGNQPGVCAWHGGPRAWDWTEVAKALL